MNELSKIPYFGVGIGLRNEIADETFAHDADIEVVEVVSESFFSYRPSSQHQFLKRAQEKFHVIPHGVNLSIGSALPLNKDFLREVKWLTDFLDAPYYSDHFCLTGHDRLTETGHLTPLWFTQDAMDLLVDRINTIQQFIGKPLLLENITASFTIPEADYTEPEFISMVCEKTGCGLLLDVTNVFINAHNSSVDPQRLLEQYPMDHAVYIHLAGGTVDEAGVYHDTHSARIHPEVWPLYEWVLKNADIKVTIIERDEDFDDDFNSLILEDIRHIRTIQAKVGQNNCISSETFETL